MYVRPPNFTENPTNIINVKLCDDVQMFGLMFTSNDWTDLNEIQQTDTYYRGLNKRYLYPGKRNSS